MSLIGQDHDGPGEEGLNLSARHTVLAAFRAVAGIPVEACELVLHGLMLYKCIASSSGALAKVAPIAETRLIPHRSRVPGMLCRTCLPAIRVRSIPARERRITCRASYPGTAERSVVRAFRNPQS
ncbi:hypothetical protein DF3PA_10214 [Candidatus Defluviicoccus seviourii]|uniref:Uncharacterized protein n=2 Tax=root TaxID=1 RepID=A0A564WC36_9PROT|nr:hypothetical protein DF3PB_660009 [uncultured Defluviicoccus sp.]VUX45089.1 hypothetical protein DF3PA_10214 [Candidatus Defluviicoccus seviourii]